MKSKLLMFIATLVASAAPIMVQAQMDVTNYIVNPSFEVNGVSGWTNNGFAAQSNNPNTFVKDRNYYIEKYIDPGKTLANSDIYQILTVPNGTYILTVAAHARVNQNTAGTAYIEGAYIYANEQSTVVSSGKDYDVQVTVVDGTLRVGFKLENSPANWVGADNFRLKGIDVDAMLPALQTLVTNALTNYPSGTKMQATVAGKLANAISAAQALIDDPTNATEASIEDVATTLNAAVNAASASVTAYAELNTAIATATANKASYTTYSGYAAFENAISIATGVYATPDADVTAVNQATTDLKTAERICKFTEPTPATFTWLIANPGFETFSGDRDQSITGWTKTGTASGEYCIRTDAGPAGKTGTGYFQYWSNANPRPDYSISQVFSGVPNGKYKVMAFAGGDANTKGTYLYANSDQKEVTANGEHEVTTLVIDNNLTIGFKSVSRTVNWSYADNFRLQYLGADLTDFENLLHEQLTIATEAQYGVEANYFSAQHYMDFQNALAAAQGIYNNVAHTADELINSTKALQVAIVTAKSSIAAQTRKAIILAAPNSDISTVLANPKFDGGTTAGWTTNMGIFNATSTKWNGWDEGYSPVPSNNYVLDKNAEGITYGYQNLPFMPAGYYIAKAVIRGQALTPSNLYLFINNGIDYLNTDGTTEGTIVADRIGDTNGSLNYGFNRYVTTGITVSEGDNITLGIRADNGTTVRWQSADAFELHYYPSEVDFMSIEKEELLVIANTIITENEKMAAIIKTALNTAMNADWNNLSTTDFHAALGTLKNTITAANASIAEYLVLDNFLANVESALSDYSSYSGYATYSTTVADAIADYMSGATVDVQAAILDLKMAKNTCIFSDGAINDDPNLLYGWDAKQSGETPEAAGWIASQHDVAWGGKLTGPNDNLDAFYRSDAASNYAFFARATKNEAVITYAYPVYLEAGKHYFFSGKNWRRNGQYVADATNVTFAVSSTASKTGTILAEQTVFCNSDKYFDYSFAFNVTNTGVYYFIRYAAEGSTNLQDASAVLSLVETYSLINGKATVTGELTEGLKTELAATGITSVDLTNATAANNVELTFDNPNTVVYGVPANVTLINGITEGSTAELDENYPFHAPLGLTANISYERAAFTGMADGSSENGWQSIVLPFDVTSITSVDGDGKVITLVPFENYVEASGEYPFWLYQVEDKLFKAASSIEANTTYLISFPNGSSSNALNVNGPVTFHGTAIAATVGLDAQPVTNAYTLNPNFSGLKSDVYALNTDGSKWEKNSSVKSFYGYVTDPVAANAPQFLPVFGDVTGMKNITAKTINHKKMIVVTADNGVIIESEEAGRIIIYSANGQQITTVVLQEGSNFIALPAGEYIINGAIAIVK